MKRVISTTAMIALLINMAAAQSATQRGAKSDHKESSGNTQPAAASSPVTGSGTPGRISKWTGVFGSTNFTLGDSNITEDKFGNVGIGTDSPTSKLTVAGTIEASGGSSVLHNPTLMGNGTAASPLSVAVPLSLRGSVPIGAIIPAVVAITNTEQGGTGVSGRGHAETPFQSRAREA